MMDDYMLYYYDGYLAGWFGSIETPTVHEIELSEGQTGKLNSSCLPFKITKVEGDTVTIRYLNSRQEWTGPKTDLVARATIDATIS